MAVKEVDSSVSPRAKDLADAEAPGSFLEKELEEWCFYSAAVAKLSTPFQTPLKRANDTADNLILLDWLGKGVHVWALLRQKRIEKVAFPSDYGWLGETTDFYTIIADYPSNWSDDILESALVEKLRLVSSETVNRIKGFASLGDNWDSYGAKTIEWSTIIKAIDFFSNLASRFPDAPLPFVAPARNGDIHFEWEKCSKVLKHSIPEDENDHFEYLLTDKTSGKIEKRYGRAVNMEEMLDVAANWIR